MILKERQVRRDTWQGTWAELWFGQQVLLGALAAGLGGATWNAVLRRILRLIGPTGKMCYVVNSAGPCAGTSLG